MPARHLADQQATRTPGRKLRPGRAAPGTETEPQALRPEYPKNHHLNNQCGPLGSSLDQPQQTAKRTRRTIQDLQNKVVAKLGNGNAAAGWQVFGSLPTHARKLVENLEADGQLTREAVRMIVAEADDS